MKSVNKTDEQIMQAIDVLFLEPIKFKLMDEKEGKGWSLEQVDAVEKWYKRFLFLSAKYPQQPLVPTLEIDAFWHQHILDTRKYQEDCDTVFGYFLHHFPYLGMRGEEDAKKLSEFATTTWDLYEKHFSESVHELAKSFSKIEAASCKNHPPPTCSCSSCSSCSGGSCSSVIDTFIRPIPERSRSIQTSPHTWR